MAAAPPTTELTFPFNQRARMAGWNALFHDGKPYQPDTTRSALREPLPMQPSPLAAVYGQLTRNVLPHSMGNQHPRFWGWYMGAGDLTGALADFLAASVNPNVGANILSPMATAIEKQTVKWLTEFIGAAPTCGGLLVSGGNMANFTAFLAARTAKAPKSGFNENCLVS